MRAERLLVSRSSGGRHHLEQVDFTLPGEVTDDVVSVYFDSDGDIDDIAMAR